MYTNTGDAHESLKGYGYRGWTPPDLASVNLFSCGLCYVLYVNSWDVYIFVLILRFHKRIILNVINMYTMGDCHQHASVSDLVCFKINNEPVWQKNYKKSHSLSWG